MTGYLELADYLLIAEAVLGVPTELIADFNRIGLADSALAAPQAGFGGVEAHQGSEEGPPGALRHRGAADLDRDHLVGPGHTALPPFFCQSHRFRQARNAIQARSVTSTSYSRVPPWAT